MLEALLRSTIRRGAISVAGASRRPIVVGDGGAGGPEVAIRLTGRMTPFLLALRPDLALGEAYVDGRLEIERGSLDDLFDLIGLNLPNRPPASPLRQALGRLSSRHHAAQAPRAAARNVAHHYDISEDLYRFFLDETMQYSCAYFERPDVDLSAAQQAKMAHIIAKLDVRPDHHVLDIGCGWGGLALRLAKDCQARVTGITLSRQQLEVARRRAHDAGLDDRVRFELMDYRDAVGEFERVVSVGMFEHVGPRHYRTFFDAVRDRLTTDGVALLHSIGAGTGGGGSNPWIRKYIFPGGYIPTLSETIKATEAAGLWVCDVEILRLHYAETLAHWLRRFRQHRSAAKALYDERFCRMWEFYLASCAMAFRYGELMVMQIQLAKRVDTLPTTRAYMEAAERRLRNACRDERSQSFEQARA